jgi:histidinol dehydrogenase
MSRIERIVDPEVLSIEQLLARPDMDSASVADSVSHIIEMVREQGDGALIAYARQFDGAQLQSVVVFSETMEKAKADVDEDLRMAIGRAKENIERFHRAQKPTDERVETEPGVYCWRKSVPLKRVGLYIPGGSAPLFSTVLMLAVPARIAGCGEIVLCTPPRPDGTIDPAILYAASISGVTKVIASGGAQAIAALAFGTESVPAVDKIFGPGNRFVTEAKQQVAGYRCAIDMPAGPSEVMVVIDSKSNPDFAAADMLSQAEHGPDSQVILVVLSDDVVAGEALVDRVEQKMSEQMKSLNRIEVIEHSLKYAKAVIVTSMDLCAEVVNRYAPEHLIINISNFVELERRVVNAGSVFLGMYSCESAGDYASGTNHTLPTSGWARSHSGVSLDSFLKKITFQRITQRGLRSLGPTIETMAKAEKLDAHAAAVRVRLHTLGKEKK